MKIIETPSNVCNCDCAKCKKQNNTDCCVNRECDMYMHSTCKWCDEWEKYDDNNTKQETAEIYIECDEFVTQMETDVDESVLLDLVEYTADNEVPKDRYYGAMCKYIHKHKFYPLVDRSCEEHFQFKKYFNEFEWYEFMKMLYPTKKQKIPRAYQNYLIKVKHFSKKGKCMRFNCRIDTDLIQLDCQMEWYCYGCYKYVEGECDCTHVDNISMTEDEMSMTEDEITEPETKLPPTAVIPVQITSL